MIGHVERPAVYAFNGPDTFLLILDQLMLKSSGRGNICHLLVTLDEPVATLQIQAALDENTTYQWMCTLRAQGGSWFKPPRWAVDQRARAYPVPFYLLADTNALELIARLRMINPRRESPFQVQLLGQKDTTTQILITWHHALMDAHGAELFVAHIGQSLAGEPVFFDPNPDVPDHSQWRNTLKIKESLDEISHLPFMSTYIGRGRSRPVVRHQVIALTEKQTGAVDEKITATGAQINKSLFYLAACARAVRHIVTARGGTVDDVVVSVPQDRRRRGAAGPMLSNQVTFLFYRISAAGLDSLKGTVTSLSEQMMDLMRQDFPARFHRMMLLCRHLPPFIYRHMIQQPTGKRMASFFISDTGQSLDRFETFLGAPVKNAIHYPPNMYPPGLTFIFARYKGRLSVTITTMEEELEDVESEALVAALKTELVTPAE
tara:strand:- start:1546 stop:2844 length:1299 start_codon:yes stop_codon:yes gene_type:complete